MRVFLTLVLRSNEKHELRELMRVKKRGLTLMHDKREQELLMRVYMILAA